MIVAVNMSKEVFEYYDQYGNWDELVNKLLELYDITMMPPVKGERYTQRKVNVTNENYIALYEQLGAKNKMLSLARLLEFGFECDVLSTSMFKNMTYKSVNTDSMKVIEYLKNALSELSQAKRFAIGNNAVYVDMIYKTLDDIITDLVKIEKERYEQRMQI